jgi:MoaA/NifB/PqqE/SkfB family radical SAM enzyme
VSYYVKGQKDGDWWIELNNRLYKHNPDIFHILYGGEIFLHPDHTRIVKHMNDIGVAYTIISSANDGIRPIIDKFFKEVGYVKGFTCSIDPGFYKHFNGDRKDFSDDALYKANRGYAFLKHLIDNNLVLDPVAEITTDCDSIHYLEETVKILTDQGITSDITMIDSAKNHYYDFSSIVDETRLVQPTDEVRQIFENLKNSDYKIHMKDLLMDNIFNTLPATADCEMEKGWHNLTIEPTGECRLCLRIRGIETPNSSAMDIFDEDGNPTLEYFKAWDSIRVDKEKLCQGCQWSCISMSGKGTSEGIINH